MVKPLKKLAKDTLEKSIDSEAGQIFLAKSILLIKKLIYRPDSPKFVKQMQDKFLDTFSYTVRNHPSKVWSNLFKGVLSGGAFNVFATISPTNRCDKTCPDCYAGHIYKQYTIPESTLRWTLDQMHEPPFNTRFQVISGGEPTLKNLYGERDLVDILSHYQDTTFLVYTNGRRLARDKEFVERAAKAGNITFSVSIEGFEKETDARRGKGTHADNLKAFENMREQGMVIGASITANKYNTYLLLDSEDKMINYYIDKGVNYFWVFQYMPIGKDPNSDLLLTSQQRADLTQKYLQLLDKGIFIADFWGSGTLSNGCISAGKGLPTAKIREDGKDYGGGYIYIWWTGDIAPCVFIPYKEGDNKINNLDNIRKRGGKLEEALQGPFFRAIRQWHREYYQDKPKGEKGNLLLPCRSRDHSKEFYEIVKKTGAKPIDDGAKAYLGLIEKGIMPAYNIECQKCLNPTWEKVLQGGDYNSIFNPS